MFQLLFSLSLILVSLMCVESAAGNLALSPSGVATACLGDKVSFTCTIPGLTTEDFLDWNVTVISDESGERSATRLISAAGQNIVIPIVINMKTFNVSSQSAINSNGLVTLTSVLTIANVTQDLNGTSITCTVLRGTRNDSSSSTAVVEIIGADNVESSSPEIDNTTIFGRDTVTVVLELAHVYRNGTSVSATYDVNVDQQANDASTIWYYSNSSVQLTLHYNTDYNVTITTMLCGHTTSTTVIELHYVRCGNLSHQLTDDSVLVTSDHTLTLVGAIGIFNCPPGLILRGPNTTTCMENGRWTPNPTLVECKTSCGPLPSPKDGFIFPFASRVEGSMVTIVCSLLTDSKVYKVVVCNQHGIWEPDPSNICSSVPTTGDSNNSAATIGAVVSLVIVMILSSIIFFVVGFFSGRFSKREKSSSNIHTSEDATIQTQSLQQSVVYENVVLKQNAAYCKVTPTVEDH